MAISFLSGLERILLDHYQGYSSGQIAKMIHRPLTEAEIARLEQSRQDYMQRQAKALEQHLQQPRIQRPQEPILMGVPKGRITKAVLELANQVLGQKLAWSSPDGMIKSWVELAVSEQWRQFAPERFLAQPGMQRLNQSRRGNQLWRFKRMIYYYYDCAKRQRIEYYLSYRCPSTGKLYVSPVPHGLRTADSAMAWKFDLAPDEYRKLKIET